MDEIIPKKSNEDDTIQKIFNNKNVYMKRIIGDLEFENDHLSSILQGDKLLQIASDVSVINNQGTTAWAIWHNNKKLYPVNSSLMVYTLIHSELN